ncbi:MULTISPECIES: phosphoglycerate kinase [unclassified Bradyrhizobium]|uniref:phosphoglycerate kinase n=1 Tax=unclassified Bradyrhizobium TaxID=2631580 RepID=UPI00247A9245|nr:MULTISPECIES: phosphoglycerate kinase [unclassified Bradyrhizobium]WGR95350.1 phosphoglycerate kinase [Bradyrhizobium sp. ISRA435]WGS00343.1 phosphoglycerate kinase [Bradyrhizobium sp. ISRA436]WGS07232.1 phosphoglycerate kinase [Bradyrhizobium sp. ISRA437]WGS14117.1 phosphoglycerate kinase [Bradyrhizobium sp. ISRA443]WGS19837.1 phosphoglycerate kinase [Bradyrhizobium sp. ISRA463]
MTKSFRTLDDVDVKGKRVLLRVDLNVPMENGRVTDATRLERVAPTITEISDKGGKVILLAHFGRPKGRDPKESLKPVAEALSEVIKRPVAFADDCIGDVAAKAVAALKDGDILCLENTRFHKEEEKNDAGFVAELAKLGDIWVNDAFSAAHRAHASTEGLGHKLPAYAGRTMQAELDALGKALEAPTKPVIAIIGGAKVSTKIDLLENLVTKVDALVIGGGMANTFLHAQGVAIGKSLAEKDLAATALKILDKANASNCAIILPVDAVVASQFSANAPSHAYGLDAIPADGMILDVGPQSIARIHAAIDDAATLVWNGPLGAFELTPFDRGTVVSAKHAAERTKVKELISVAGGGDTVAALNQAGVAGDFSYVSTAGGAFLEWMEGKPLPGVEVLKKG